MSDWNPQKLPKNLQFIINLIHGLKEGQDVWFSQDNVTGHQGVYVHIKKISNGREYEYHAMGDLVETPYLESDEDIEILSSEILKHDINYYNVSFDPHYKKVRPDIDRDDQSIGHYPTADIEYPTPQYENKKSTMKKELLEYLIRTCAKEVLGQLNENKNSDPSKEDMLNFLRTQYGNEEGFEDSAEVAIYWFSNFYHGGQNSNLYSAGSTSRFSPGRMSRGPEPGTLEEMMYEDLVSHFFPGSEESNAFEKKHASLNEDETEGVPAPPADGQGTGDQPEIPKDTESQPEKPEKKETPPAAVNIKGVAIVNPRDKSKIQKVELGKMMDDATIERTLHRIASAIGGGKIKTALSTLRLVKDAIKNPASATFLYVGKQDPESDELFLLADKSLQIAKDSSVDVDNLNSTSGTPDSSFDPATADAQQYATHLTSAGRTQPVGMDETLKKMIKEAVTKILNK